MYGYQQPPPWGYPQFPQTPVYIPNNNPGTSIDAQIKSLKKLKRYMDKEEEDEKRKKQQHHHPTQGRFKKQYTLLETVAVAMILQLLLSFPQFLIMSKLFRTTW